MNDCRSLRSTAAPVPDVQATNFEDEGGDRRHVFDRVRVWIMVRVRGTMNLCLVCSLIVLKFSRRSLSNGDMPKLLHLLRIKVRISYITIDVSVSMKPTWT
jgi:hypothetical protein